MDDLPQPVAIPSNEGGSASLQPSVSPVAESAPSPLELNQPHVVSDDPPWILKDLGRLLLLAIVSFLAVMILAVIVLVVLELAFGWKWNPSDHRYDTPLGLFLQGLMEIGVVFFTYRITASKYQRPFLRAISWNRVRQHEAAYFLGGIALGLLWITVFQFVHLAKRPPIAEMFNTTLAVYSFAFSGICVAPFVEELIFRGLVYPIIERRWGFWVAVLGTALLFATVHSPQLGNMWPLVVWMFGVGALLSYIRGTTGSIVPSFLVHTGYNFMLFSLLYVFSDRFRSFGG
jgi:CAAX protease family protein